MYHSENKYAKLASTHQHPPPPRNIIIHYTTLHHTTPHHTTPHHTSTHHHQGISSYTTLHYTTLHHTTPHNTTPAPTTTKEYHHTLHYTILHNTTPHHTTPQYITLLNFIWVCKLGSFGIDIFRPARCQLSLSDSMVIFGGRHPYYMTYEVLDVMLQSFRIIHT